VIRKLKDYVIDDIRLFVQCNSKLFHELSFSLHPCFINSRGYSVELEENIHINLRPGYTKQFLLQLAT
jgi:hypothetical protein